MGAEMNISHLFAGKFSNINKPAWLVALIHKFLCKPICVVFLLHETGSSFEK